MSITFRRARPDDLGAIVAIFNESVDLPINDEVELITPASRRDWLAEFTDDFPLWVAEQDGRVVGWCGLACRLGRSSPTFTGATRPASTSLPRRASPGGGSSTRLQTSRVLFTTY